MMVYKETKKSPNIIFWLLLAISMAFNFYQWTNHRQQEENYDNKVDSLLSSRVDIEKELNDSYIELNKYKGISNRLDSLLKVAGSKVDEHKARLEELMNEERNTKTLNKKLQKELADLKALREEYLEKIDYLLVENEQLKKDKTELTTTVASLTKNLANTVSSAAIIKSEYYVVSAFKKRSNDKYAATVIARRTNKLEACFTLLDNAIAKPGIRNLYLRILEPGGKVLGNRSTGSMMFRKSGSDEDILFTSTKQIDYQNARQNICLEWEDAERNFSPGTYLLEVYVEGSLSGVGSVNLK